MEIYAIYEGHMEHLAAKLKPIARKCERAGIPFVCNEVGEEFHKVKDPDTQIVYTFRYVLLEVEGTVAWGPWEVIGQLTHVNGANVILTSKDNTEIIPKQFRTAKIACEHCNTRRVRNSTYILHNKETDEWKQVGSNCLQEFTGGISANAAAARISWIELFEDAANSTIPREDFGTPYHTYYNMEDLVATAVQVVRTFGYVKSVEFRSTKERTLEVYRHEHGYIDVMSRKQKEKLLEDLDRMYTNLSKEAARQYAKEALAWIRSEDLDVSSDYMHNLSTVCKSEAIASKFVGIAVSLVTAYDRQLDKAKQLARAQEVREAAINDSEFVGNIGDKIDIIPAQADCLTSYDTMYGPTYIFRFIDDLGRVFIWKTSNGVDTGKVTKVSGRVKDHTIFRDVKQTVLTRCKVTYA